jgi:hypothetical protein
MSGKPPKHRNVVREDADAVVKVLNEQVKTLAKTPAGEGETSRKERLASLRDVMTFRNQTQMGEWARQGKIKQEGIVNRMATARNVSIGQQGGKTRRNGGRGGDIVSHLLTIRNQVKLYHWQTGSFARHTATDNLTAALDTNIDAFVESYMGRYGRPKVRGSIKLHNFSESAARAFVAKETKYLTSELPKKIGKNDTDLLNLRDTILGDLTKVLYLFTLQ